MCYSKEVSLVSGLSMSAASFFFWLKFVSLKIVNDNAFRERATSLRDFFINAILAYACIGGHQIVEFFAILTGDQLIYKLGLISSITSVFFGARALEKLTKTKIGSTFILAIIGMVSLDILFTKFDFSNYHFWVRGENHTIWSTAWFSLWTYAMFSGLYLSNLYSTAINKKLLRFAFLGVMNVSFLLSLGYAIFGTMTVNVLTCSQNIFQGFVFGKDFPSIWCTFSVMQAPFLYVGFLAIAKHFILTDSIKEKYNPQKRMIAIALLTITFMVLLKLLVPIVFGVSMKMITK